MTWFSQNINHEFITLKLCSCVKAYVWGLVWDFEIFYGNFMKIIIFYTYLIFYIFLPIYLPRCAYLLHRDHSSGKSSFL